jgi:hypothetical protein
MGLDPTPSSPVAPRPGLSSRKFIVTCGTLVMAFVLALLGKLTADFATIAAVVVGTFHAAHAVQDWPRGE